MAQDNSNHDHSHGQESNQAADIYQPPAAYRSDASELPNQLPPAGKPHRPPKPPYQLTRRQKFLLILVAMIAAASLAYRFIYVADFQRSALMFVGLPVFIAILCVLLPSPRSATLNAMRGTLVFLAISGVALGEGAICVLMATPIGLIIAAIAGGIIDIQRRNRHNRNKRMYSMLALTVLAALSLEGVVPGFEFDRDNTVTVTQVLPLTADQVEQRLMAPAVLPESMPLYLQLGFPLPTAIEGQVRQKGDRMTIHFPEHQAGVPAQAVFEVVAKSTNAFRVHVVEDSSKIASWMAWQSSQIEWQPVASDMNDTGQTAVTITIRYQRMLDPAWYFQPWQNYAVEKTAEAMLQGLLEHSSDYSAAN